MRVEPLLASPPARDRAFLDRLNARLDGEPDFARLNALVKQCFDSEDYVEGRTAFMQKRKPVFNGR